MFAAAELVELEVETPSPVAEVEVAFPSPVAELGVARPGKTEAVETNGTVETDAGLAEDEFETCIRICCFAAGAEGPVSVRSAPTSSSASCQTSPT